MKVELQIEQKHAKDIVQALLTQEPNRPLNPNLKPNKVACGMRI